MAANIQWDVFQSGHTYLVRMLCNERPAAFKPGCAPVSRGSLFYNLTELESCYGDTGSWHPAGTVSGGTVSGGTVSGGTVP